MVRAIGRIGVFICHCGTNIADTVDVEKLAENLRRYPGVVHSVDYTYLCSQPGQDLIKEAIAEKGLDRVVVAACSPSLHEATFRRASEEAGLNPYRCEIANIREQCSWVHEDRVEATHKAERIIKAVVEKVRLDEPLTPLKVPLTRRALVIGGGIAGIQAALDIANSGYEVVLVEREPSIGGRMAQLSETFPTLDCSQCILTPKMVEVGRHPNIELLTYSEVLEASGYVGNFKVKILKKPRYVIVEKCTACGKCAKVCPVVVPNEFDRGLSSRHAIDIPFPQAVPTAYYLNEESCLGLFPLVCDKCARACDAGAIDYDMQPEIIECEVGAIVVATGYELYPAEQTRSLGWGKHADVVDGLEFERMLSATGPTGGEIRRPSDGKVPKEVVFIQCVGSRDPEGGLPYCSKICCMYTAKHAMLYKHKVPDGQAYVFYMDIRAGGKGYEEFVQRAIEEDGVLYLRGRVSRVFQEDDKVIVWSVDTLSGKEIEIAADLVVLATAMVPSQGAMDLARKLRIATDEYGFYSEAHPKLRPVESLTAGIYLAGAAQAPKDIPEAVAQASGAAAKVCGLFSSAELSREPLIAVVSRLPPPVFSSCTGCFLCEKACPYQAIEREEIKDKKGNVLKVAARVNEGLCQGCGTCVALCRVKAIDLQGFTNEQVLAEVLAL